MKNGFEKQLHLIMGEEAYLKEKRLGQLIEMLPQESRDMNLDIIDKIDSSSLQEVLDKAMHLPFFAENRLVVLKGTGALDNKSLAEQFLAFFQEIPLETIFVFVEDKADKRTKLYKHIAKEGLVFEAALPKENALADWAIDICKQEGKTLPKNAAIHAIRRLPQNMHIIENEMRKLCSYMDDSSKISVEEIERVCTKSAQAKIFDLMRDIAGKDAAKARENYRTLIFAKEPPMMILSMIIRQIRFSLWCKSLSFAMPQAEIAKSLSLRDFAVREFIQMANVFKKTALLQAYTLCSQTDIDIKTGKMDAELAVELLIVKIIESI